jgi:protein arginine kinase activator
MQYCTACQKNLATVTILDLAQGSLVGTQAFCQPCAEQLGVAAPAAPKFGPEALENILASALAGRRPARTEVCPGCNLTLSEFRSKGRLGCPRCYETFRAELMPLLQRIHEAQVHTGRLPAVLAKGPPPPDERSLSDVRRRLEDAVRGERYEEAARLRDELRRLERGSAT